MPQNLVQAWYAVATTLLLYHRTKSEINIFHEILGLPTFISHLWANWEKYISESTKGFAWLLFIKAEERQKEKNLLWLEVTCLVSYNCYGKPNVQTQSLQNDYSVCMCPLWPAMPWGAHQSPLPPCVSFQNIPKQPKKVYGEKTVTTSFSTFSPNTTSFCFNT